MKQISLYDILGIFPNASSEEIKTAYRQLAQRFHPDKHNGDALYEEKFREIKDAYEILSDSQKREEYDLKHGFKKIKFDLSNLKKTATQQAPVSNAPNFWAVAASVAFIGLILWAVSKK